MNKKRKGLVIGKRAYLGEDYEILKLLFEQLKKDSNNE